jgi:glycosyltransferase involved in cell wall biosynthesis
MRILVVTHYPVFPLSHGGSVRVLRLAEGLAGAGAEVDVFVPWYPGQRRAAAGHRSVRVHSHVSAGNLLPALLPERAIPGVVAFSLQPRWLQPRRRLRLLGPYDIVQLESPAVFPWGDAVDGDPRLVYDAHNVESDYVRDRIGQRFGRKAVARVLSLEGRAVRGCDLLLTCTDVDLARLTELYGEPAAGSVVRTGYSEALTVAESDGLRDPARAELGIAEHERVLLFLAGRAKHNLEAARWLEEEVMPKLDESHVLLVVGRVSPAKEESRDGARVLRLGFVEHLPPIFAAADVALNPVMTGSGSSVKVMDYLGAGLPIVSTPIGARGFASAAERIRVAEPADFAGAISETLASLAPRAYEETSEFHPIQIGSELLARYEELLSRPGTRTRAN